MPQSFIETVTPDGLRIDHLLMTQEQPRGLLILLPGWGYTCDYPVLYYLRKAARTLDYNVLSVRYSFQVAPQVGDKQELTPEALAAEVDQAVRQALKPDYAHVVIAGKSLGTPLAVRYAAQAERLILLTPIGTSVEDSGATKPTLAVIGTDDPVYQPELVEAAGANVQWLVLDQLNHGLEMPGDWAASLDALRQITQTCADFLP
ncbi:MAG: hypothetical protein ABI835_00250 [Chloroflexota bacterium]